MNTKLGWIPVLNKLSENFLTIENWRELNVSAVSYDFSDLLVKPGYNYLLKNPDLSEFFGWRGKVILNASSINRDKNNNFKLKSPYDGRIILHNFKEIYTLIKIINPNYVLLPQDVTRDEINLINKLPSTIFPLYFINNLPSQVQNDYGVYWNPAQQKLEHNFRGFCKKKLVYILGEFPKNFKNSNELNILGFESNAPMSTGVKGKVYFQNNFLDLTEKHFALDFNLIEESCDCLACSKNMTRAYLHHLITNVPLLAERILIQHNVHKFKSYNSDV